jgi:hypothetical protein
VVIVLLQNHSSSRSEFPTINEFPSTSTTSTQQSSSSESKTKNPEEDDEWNLAPPVVQLTYENLNKLCILASKPTVCFFFILTFSFPLTLAFVVVPVLQSTSELKTQFGSISQVLGERRQKLTELFLVLLRCDYKRINIALEKLKVLPYVLVIFFSYFL